jgi:integrase
VVPVHMRQRNFLDYFEEVAKTKLSCNWSNALNYLKLHFGSSVTFEELTPSRLSEFRDYLVKTLHINTAYSYLATTKAALNRAVKDGIIPTSPAARIDGIKRIESRRAYLTIDELRLLAKTSCPNDEVKRAFLWACYSGQARCDVRSLLWNQIQGTWLYYHRNKTKDELVAVALPQQALDILGERGAPDELVFSKLPVNRYIGIVLNIWAQRAGITKNVTFHVARHTFATLSLTYGGDVYTVSKQLGHKHVRTTQTYAKVVDERRRAVADSLPTLNEAEPTRTR